MMRFEPRDEDPNVNIVLRSGITTGDDKGKQPGKNGWFRKAPEKEFDGAREGNIYGSHEKLH